MAQNTDIIGTGFAFPMGTNDRGGILTTTGDHRIEDSILLILSTAPGERVMRPEFGCTIWDLVFAPIDTVTLNDMAAATTRALRRWEPRIQVNHIETQIDDDDPTRVDISIHYEVLATNDRRNLVYPFYVIPREGE